MGYVQTYSGVEEDWNSPELSEVLLVDSELEGADVLVKGFLELYLLP
jgi:hypothetical protein